MAGAEARSGDESTGGAGGGDAADAGELALGRELAGELTGMRVRFTGSGHDTYGAGRSGSHDDLVLALGLACWGKRFG